MQTRRDIIGLIGAAILVGPAHAGKGDWVSLGSRSVNLLKDRDAIYVGVQKGLFTGLKLRADGKGIFMERLLVRFANGDSVEIPVRSFIQPKSETREMLLPSLVRAIRQIDLTYRKIPVGGASKVTVFGRTA